MSQAIQKNDDDVCEIVQQWLSKNRRSVNTQDSENKTALHYAAEQHNVEVTTILMEADAGTLYMTQVCLGDRGERGKAGFN